MTAVKAKLITFVLTLLAFTFTACSSGTAGPNDPHCYTNVKVGKIMPPSKTVYGLTREFNLADTGATFLALNDSYLVRVTSAGDTVSFCTNDGILVHDFKNAAHKDLGN